MFAIYVAAIPILLLGTLAVFNVPGILARSPFRLAVEIAFCVLPLVAAWRAWVLARAIKRLGFDLAPGKLSAGWLIVGAIGLILVALGLYILIGGLMAFAEVDRQIAGSASPQQVGLYRSGGTVAFFLAAAVVALGGVMAWPLVRLGLRGRVATDPPEAGPPSGPE